MKKIYIVLVVLLLFIISGCYSYSKNPLYKALENVENYKYQIEIDDGESIMNQEFIYEKSCLQVYTRINGIISLVLCNDQEHDNVYMIKNMYALPSERLENNSAEFESLRNKYFEEFYLLKLNSQDFNFDGIKYSVKDKKLEQVCNEVFNLSISGEFTNLDVYVENDFIKEVKTGVNVDGKNYSVKVTVSNINSTHIYISSNDNKTITNVSISHTAVKVSEGTSLETAINGIYLSVEYVDDSEIFWIIYFEYSCDSYNSSKGGVYPLTVTALGYEFTVAITVLDNGYDILTDFEILQEYADKNKISYGLPSIGNSKALVIPVEFTDYKASPDMKSNLEKAFFGTAADTGWESLSSYYYKSSYGKLNISGTVLDVYNTGNTSSYYNKKYENGADADYLIIKEVLEYYDSQVNYDEYDSNNDGYIDALYIVYTTPVDYDSDTSLWWAFTYEYFTDDYEYYDNVEADYYCFLGYDFLFEETASKKEVLLNTETIIHETGHLLGLDDYYDYDDSKGPSGGIGGGDMMDYNIGDHNPFSKILMGWVTPYVVTGDCSIELGTFGEAGDCIILTDEFTSIYDEYYIIDYYSSFGLNELEAGHNGLFSRSGVRIYHVDARLSKDPVDSVIEIFEFDNSYTSHKLISLFQASGSNSINRGEFSTNDDLLKYQKDYTINNWYTKDDVEFVINAVFDSSTVRINITKK